MAELETKRDPLALRAFRHTGRVRLETAAGEVLEGRGLICALGQETGEAGAKRHALGELSRPLYRFVGWLPSSAQAVGGVMAQGEERYGVLDVRSVALGERQVCFRALLERRDGDESV